MRFVPQEFIPKLCLAIFILAAIRPMGGAPSSRTFLIGADVSALSTYEAHGAVYRMDGRRENALHILRANGFNCFRLRLFVSPDGRGIVTNDLGYTLSLARRVKAAGAKLLLDLHYSDTWADPSHQIKPAAWTRLPFPKLVTRVREYTRTVMTRFRKAGLTPDYVQLGNEITNGFLWPDGRVEYSQAPEPAAWSRLGRLLRAAYAGCADAFPAGSRPVTILHIESPNQEKRALWFCRHAAAEHVPFDMIGVSYYPQWHGSIGTLRKTLTALARDFRKPVVVAETAYPWKSDIYWRGKPHMDWPLSPTGQLAFLRDVLGVVKNLPGGLGAGVIYWHPESVPVSGLHVWLGGSCALFDSHGNVLPAAGFAGAKR